MEEAIEAVTKRFVTYALREEQLQAIKSLLSKQHVLCQFPTGYGKSDIFALTPLIWDQMDSTNGHHMALIISPLRSLMMDQVRIWIGRGIGCAAVMAGMDEDIVEEVQQGIPSVVYMSPEAAISERWMDWIRQYRKKICLLAFDEGHCIVDWGQEFRTDYGEVGILHSLLSHAPVLVCSATLTPSVQQEVIGKLNLEEEKTVTIQLLPDRHNIFLDFVKRPELTVEEALEWYIIHLREKGRTADKMIIYCRSIDLVWQTWGKLMAMLDTKAYDGSISSADKRVVEMYSHIHSGLETEKRLLMEFPKKDSVIRCLISTVAFGMGINIPDIRYVVNWGVPTSVTTYWQEVGRCARDGQPGKAIMYAIPRSINKAILQKEMISFCDNVLNGKCIRQSILCNFAENVQDDESDNQNCCSNCSNSK